MLNHLLAHTAMTVFKKVKENPQSLSALVPVVTNPVFIGVVAVGATAAAIAIIRDKKNNR